MRGLGKHTLLGGTWAPVDLRLLFAPPPPSTCHPTIRLTFLLPPSPAPGMYFLWNRRDQARSEEEKCLQILKNVSMYPIPGDTLVARLTAQALLNKRLHTYSMRSSMIQQRPWEIIMHFDAPWNLLALCCISESRHVSPSFPF